MSKKTLIIGIILPITLISAMAEPRNALLIANGRYKNFSSLTNPIPEATALANSLKQLGFDVIVKTNLSLDEMQLCLVQFEAKVKKDGGIAFFHYGGHAVQVNGENYLIPSDADIESERRVKARALDLDEVMASMRGDTNIVILDACRNNPLPATEGRSASRGLVPVANKPKNSLIVYSAQAGSTAQDGVFTPILTEKILEHKSFTAIIREVRNEVSLQTNNMQNPGSYDELNAEIYLASASNDNDINNPVYKDDSNKRREFKKRPKKQLSQEQLQIHRKLYMSLIGIGSAISIFPTIFIPVGAANAVDCYVRNFAMGSEISFALLGVGIGFTLVSAAMIVSSSCLWYSETINNSGLKKNINYYRHNRYTNRQRIIAAFCIASLYGNYNYNTDEMSVGVEIKL